MKTDDGLRFSKLRDHGSIAQCSGILDSAFSIPKYIENFPHIFSPSSSAQIFSAVNSAGDVVALCAVDTEIWSEPTYVRGACIGSVAVDPSVQRRGVGHKLLSWVLAQLAFERRHDFIYLFSDQPRFYEQLGFKQAGVERLFSPQQMSMPQTEMNEVVFQTPFFSSNISPQKSDLLWRALELGRLCGESHASLAKLRTVLSIPEMLISWIESPSGEILAGAFIGKGADFRGVVHTFFAQDEHFLKTFWMFFLNHAIRTKSELLVAPGAWRSVLNDFLTERSSQTLCLVASDPSSQLPVKQWIDSQCIYPRALFSS